MNSSIKIIVMRHGESENNVMNKCSSSTMPIYPLTPKGRTQVLNQALLLRQSQSIDFILSSPILRTYETATLVAEVFNMPINAIKIESRLKEPFFGTFEDRPYKDYLRAVGNQKPPYDFEKFDGESKSSIEKRIESLLTELMNNETFKNKTILLVTHSFLINHFFKLFKVDNDRLPKQASCVFFELPATDHSKKN